MKSRRRCQLWLAVLLLPFAALLCPALYAFALPSVGGIPFFYWYQFGWLIISAALTALVAARTR